MRDWLDRLRSRALSGSRDALPAPKYADAEDRIKYLLISGLALLVLLSGFFFDSPGGIGAGLVRIISSPSTLLSDYLAIGGPGAAFVNCGGMMLLCLAIARTSRAEMNGSTLAAVLMVGGFSLFGKNPFNALPILLGVFLHARYRGENFSRHTPTAFFGLAAGPMVSYLAFGLGWPLACALPIAFLTGLAIGFILPMLAAHFANFHRGYTLYNMGFTCGIIGLALMSLLRAFGLGNEAAVLFPLEGLETPLLIWVLSIIALMGLAGWLLSSDLKGALKALMQEPGRPATDFVTRYGIGPVLVNMALSGLIATGYVFLSGGRLTGPTMGAILSVMSFGGFGKHPRNIWPILAGAQIMARLGIWQASSDTIVIAALFGTNLAPIPGSFGWPAGILAGFLHLSTSANLSYLHGYTNLYNNGFSGGFVAALLGTLIIALRRRGSSRKKQ